MNYKNFHGIKLSRLGMGNMRLPEKGEGMNAQIDQEKAQAIIDYAIAHGVNYFDTAYIYHNGNSEAFVGKALGKYKRDSYYIADKFNMMANPDYKAQFNEQLLRLQTDYIDFYLLHGVQDFAIDELLTSGCIEYFRSLKDEGKIKYFGFSFHGSPEGLRHMLATGLWDFVQIQLNYYDWAYGDAKALYEILEEHHIPIMVMEPVHGGRLANLTEEANALLKSAEPDKSIASWAMRWVMRLPNVQVVLSGMSNMEQVEDNVRTFEENQPLTEEQCALVRKAGDFYRPTVTVACTQCRYCCNDCPKELDIPGLLKVYNDMKLDASWRLFYLENFAEDKKPTACIGCGSCKRHCPQGFDIPRYMKEMAGIYEMMKK